MGTVLPTHLQQESAVWGPRGQPWGRTDQPRSLLRGYPAGPQEDLTSGTLSPPPEPRGRASVVTRAHSVAITFPARLRIHEGQDVSFSPPYPGRPRVLRTESGRQDTGLRCWAPIPRFAACLGLVDVTCLKYNQQPCTAFQKGKGRMRRCRGQVAEPNSPGVSPVSAVPLLCHLDRSPNLSEPPRGRGHN